MFKRRLPKTKLLINVAKNEIVTVETDFYVENIDIKGMTPWEKLEAIKGVILRSGIVWTRKVEKMARKNLSV